MPQEPVWESSSIRSPRRRRAWQGGRLMEVIHSRCAGLDVHKETVVACVRLAAGDKITREVKSFETTTSGLLGLLAWLSEQGCTHAAMEATGVYWKPVWNILSDGDFELVLANAAHIKNVPGRKTDVSDAAWIADLLAHALIRSRFVPEQQAQELRELLRTRKQLIRQQTSHILRLQKTLEAANIKLDSVITDIVGKSGRAIIEALLAGETNPVKLAAPADPRIQARTRNCGKRSAAGSPVIIGSCCISIFSISISPMRRSAISIRAFKR